MSQKNLLPVRKGRARKPSDASVLLHALVVALRDDKPKSDIVKLVACYPRIMNRSNPILQLVEENARLREQLGEHVDQADLMREIDGQLETWKNKRTRTRKSFFGQLAKFLSPSPPKGDNGAKT